MKNMEGRRKKKISKHTKKWYLKKERKKEKEQFKKNGKLHKERRITNS